MPPSRAGGQLLSLLLLLSSAVIQIASSTESDKQTTTTQPNYRETKPNKFVSLSVACTKSTLMVVAAMNDPFFGLVYARGFPQTCRSDSEGQRRVKLKVNVEDCGVKVIEDEDESTHYEMMVYVQYDRHVQQAIDEQVLVRCNPEERVVVKASMSQPRDTAEVKATERPATSLAKAARRADDDEFSVGYGMEFGAPRSADAGSAELVSPASHRSPPEEKPRTAAERRVENAETVYSEAVRELAEERRREDRRPEVARCWLDILKGEGLKGDAYFEHLDVGDATTMVIKTRINDESAPMDVLVTNCSAHDGSLARSQQLIDEDGCTIDSNIMSPVVEHPQHGAGHRLHYSTFNAFKFPDRSSLHLRCTVLVCRGQCPRRHCRSRRRLTRAARLGLGLIRPVTDAELRAAGHYPIDRLLKTLQMEIKDGSTVLDRIEVFNSAEVQAPGIETVPTRLRSKETAEHPAPTTSSTGGGADSYLRDDRLMCMTSSRLLLSFGVLLAVLVLSVLIALLLCIKQRQQARKLRTLQTFQRIGTPAPTPHYYRVGPL